MDEAHRSHLEEHLGRAVAPGAESLSGDPEHVEGAPVAEGAQSLAGGDPPEESRHGRHIARGAESLSGEPGEHAEGAGHG